MSNDAADWRQLLTSSCDYDVSIAMDTIIGEPYRLLHEANVSATSPDWTEQDRRWSRLCNIYEQSDEIRAEMRSACRGRSSLLHFAHRMANQFLRAGDVRTLDLALLALSLEDGCDPRETVIRMHALSYCARGKRVDFIERAERVIAMSSTSTARMLREVLAQPGLGRDLKDVILRSRIIDGSEQLEWDIYLGGS